MPSSANTVTSKTTSGVWSATGTWVGGVLPTSADDVVIATTGTNMVTVDTSMTNKSVTINAGSILTFDATARTVTIGGSLTNNGAITNSSTSPTHKFIFSTNGFWVGSGDISNVKLAPTVNAGVTLDASGLTSPIKFRASGTFSPTINGTLIAGTQTITGGGTLTLANSGTIVTANPNGLVGATGTFNLTTAPTLNAGATYVFNGTSAQATTGLPATVNGLTITNAAGVTLSAAVTVTNLSLISGVLNTSAGATPTVSAAGSVSGTSYVNGPLAMVYSGTVSKTFPIGKGGNARSLSLNYTALTGTSTVTAEQFESNMGGTLPASTSQFLSRYWTISQSGGSAFSYGLSLNGTGFSPVGTGVILQQGSPDTSFAATFSSPNYTATGITSTGNFTLGDYVAGADQIAFTTSPRTSVAGVASGTITIQLQDNTGTPKTYSTNYTVNLSATSVTGVFRDTGDTTTITGVTILAGNDSASFSYKDTKAGTSIITASATGVAGVNQNETTTPAAASSLVFSTQPVNSFFGTTMVPVAVQVQDAFGNNVAQSGIAVSVALNGASLASGTTGVNTDANGKATFNDLVISTTATGLNFTASASGLSSATSSNFNVSITTITKAANNTAMNLSASWTGGVIPNAGTIANIDNSSVTTSAHSPDIGGSASWYGLQVGTWSANTGYTITDTAGNSVITLGAGGMQGSNTSHTLNFNAGLAFAAPQVWNWTNCSTLNVNTNGESINNNGYPLTLNGTTNMNFGGPIGGNGGITNNLGGTLTFTNGNNTFTGNLVVLAGAKIAGNATFACPVNVQTGGTIRAGLGATDTTSAITIDNDLTIAGTLINYVNSTNASTASKVTGVNHAILSGTLNLINVGPAFQAGNTFTVLLATNYSGAFTAASPATPGAGLLWNLNNISVNGSISVVALTVSPTSTNTCANSPVTLSAAAGSAGPFTYQWYDIATNAIAGETNDSITLANPASGNYTVVVSNPYGSATNFVSVTVNPLPSVSVNSATNCAGSSVMLTATTGASNPNYLWSPGGATTASITVAPVSTTIYTVTVTDGTTGCSASGNGTVTVNPLPSVTVNSAATCAGGSVMLTATTGASNPSYLWSPGGATTSSITVSPASTTVYSVTVTDGTTGCVGNGSGTVTVNPLPTVSVNSVTNGPGVSATLTATTSATSPSYLWSPGGATTASITVSPAATTSYTVIVTDGVTGCTASGSGTVTITAPSIPVIISEAITPGGEFQMIFSAPAGQTYNVLGTEDPSAALSTWSVLDSGTFGATNATYTETNMTGHVQRFYSIKSP